MTLSRSAIAVLLACPLGLSAARPVKIERVPFVGCPGDSMTGPVAAPTGQPKDEPLEAAAAARVAYYKGEGAPGVFAPAGWQCRTWSGSSGSITVVVPGEIAAKTARPSITTEAVEIQFSNGGTSGRLATAGFAARLFPAQTTAFRQDASRTAESQRLVPTPEESGGAYAADDVRSLGAMLTTFKTAPQARGLGTAGYLVPSADAIQGFGVLDAADASAPNLTIVRSRLTLSHQTEFGSLLFTLQCVEMRAGCATPPAPLRLGGTGGVVGGIAGGLIGGIPAPPPPPPPPNARPLPVGGNIKEPGKIKNVPPVYPPEAVKAKVEGIVTLEAVIAKDGTVKSVTVRKGVELLNQAAITAVKQWVYAPTLLAGVPVEVLMTVYVNFSLR